MLVVTQARTIAAKPPERDDLWLQRELNYLWSVFFSDVPRANVVEISYARFWKTRLGLITLSQSGKKTFIKINGFLRFPEVPDFVATATIAHELVHYSHGFGSPLSQKYSHPHRGGIVARELNQRGLGFEQSLSNRWLKENWHSLVASIGSESWRKTIHLSALTPYQELGNGTKVANIVLAESIASK